MKAFSVSPSQTDGLSSFQALKSRFLNRESEAARSESTSPSLRTHIKPKPIARRTVSKDKPIRPAIDHFDRHTATIKSLNETSQSMSRAQRRFKRADITLSVDETNKFPDVVWNGSTGRYPKKNPPSLYNSSRNVQSFEHYTAKQEVMQRIKAVGELVNELNTGSKKELTKPLKELFQYCIETESKTYFHVWFQLLRTFENLFTDLTKKPERPATPHKDQFEDAPLTDDLDSLMNRELDFENPKNETMSMIVKDLSKLWRTATHQITNRDTYAALENIWNAMVKILNKSISAQAARVTKSFEAANEQTKQERTRQRRLMEMITKNYDDKCVRPT